MKERSRESLEYHNSKFERFEKLLRTSGNYKQSCWCHLLFNSHVDVGHRKISIVKNAQFF